MASPTTIQFNVGGIQYVVSRSLLEMFPDTMLASLASPRWTSTVTDGETPKPIFIDRNGERFQYILDYMRDNGKVNLPISISPDAIITELEYFGFENVKEVAVFRVAKPSTRTVVDVFTRANNFFEEKQQELITINNESFRKARCLMLAKKCFAEFRREGSLIVTVEVEGDITEATEEIKSSNAEWKKEFGSLLAGVGLKLVSIDEVPNIGTQPFGAPGVNRRRNRGSVFDMPTNNASRYTFHFGHVEK